MTKPCKGCPDEVNIKPTKRFKNSWVVYVNGTFEEMLTKIQQTLPEGYTRVVFHGDGSIRYEKRPGDWEPPSPIEGYEQDSTDKCLFRPLWKSCRVRVFSTVVKESCECIQVLARCLHPDAKTGPTENIKLSTCQGCPIRQEF